MKRRAFVTKLTVLLLVLMLCFGGCVQSGQSGSDATESPTPETETNEPDSGEEAGLPEDEHTQLVVVGGGGAGMTAAVQAAYEGIDVILIEKLDLLGGSTGMATTCTWGVEDSVHQAANSDKTKEDYYNMLMEYPYMKEATALKYVEECGQQVDWLISLGVDLGKAVMGDYGVGTSDGSAPGPQIIVALSDELERLGIDVRTGTTGTELVMQDGAVAGVKVEDGDGAYTIRADAVALCTGGFPNNPEMIAEYAPEWAGIGCSSCKGDTGDGIRMALEVGAVLYDVDYVRVNPSVLYYGDSCFSMSALRHNGAVLVNKDGERFVNEQGDYTVASAAMIEQEDKCGFLVFDESLMSVELIAQQNELGYFVSADTLEELAETLGINAENLMATIETYQRYVAEGVDEAYGRTMLNVDFTNGPFYGLKVSPAMQSTFGGIATNENAQVLDEEGNPISGLYAAGEGAGSGMGGTTGTMEAFVFGKVAAVDAARYIASMEDAAA